jgi:RHS repeat-associated protein
MDDQSRIATRRVGDDDGSISGDTTPAIKYNVDDHLGSCAIQLSTTGTVVSSEEYYPFGETSFGSYAKKRYRFCGKEKDEESGLYYYGMRYYSPWTCRFMSVDPLAGKYAHLAPYAYADNKPVNHVDIDGAETGSTQESPQGKSSGGEVGHSDNLNSNSNGGVGVTIRTHMTTERTEGPTETNEKGETVVNMSVKVTKHVEVTSQSEQVSKQAEYAKSVSDLANGSDKIADKLEKKAENAVLDYRKKTGKLAMSNGKIESNSRTGKDGLPLNRGRTQDGVKVTSKGIDQQVAITTPKSQALRGASKAARYAGYLFDIKQIRDMATGKTGLGEAISSGIVSSATIKGNPAIIAASILVDLVVEKETAKFKEVEISISLQRGYDAAKEYFNTAKNSGVRMIHATHAEFEKILSGEITNSLELSDPNNPNLNWGILVSDNGKNHTFKVYGAFFLR